MAISKSESSTPKSKQSSPEAAKPKLKVRPAEDLKPNAAEGDKVRGGIQASGGAPIFGAKGGSMFSDAGLKQNVVDIADALVLLRRALLIAA